MERRVVSLAYPQPGNKHKAPNTLQDARNFNETSTSVKLIT